MKRLVIKTILLLLLVVVVDAVFGITMRSALFSTIKGDWGRRNFIVNKTHEDILVFGSSRAIHHYDPRILANALNSSCYNCAEDGNGILLHYPRIEMILQRYTPRIIIYDLIPKYDFLQYDNTSFLGILRPYSDNSLVKEVIRDIDENELLKLHSNLYKYNSSFLEILMQRFSHSTVTAKDFSYTPLASEMDYEPGPTGKFEGDGIDSLKYSYLGELADLCRSHGVELFFTASPWYKMSESDAYAPIYKLCKEKGVTFLNHNFDKSFNLDKKYFHDPAHLDQYGAETFSSLIAHEIKESL